MPQQHRYYHQPFVVVVGVATAAALEAEVDTHRAFGWTTLPHPSYFDLRRVDIHRNGHHSHFETNDPIALPTLHPLDLCHVDGDDDDAAAVVFFFVKRSGCVGVWCVFQG